MGKGGGVRLECPTITFPNSIVVRMTSYWVSNTYGHHTLPLPTYAFYAMLCNMQNLEEEAPQYHFDCNICEVVTRKRFMKRSNPSRPIAWWASIPRTCGCRRLFMVRPPAAGKIQWSRPILTFSIGLWDIWISGSPTCPNFFENVDSKTELGRLKRKAMRNFKN